MGDPRALGEDGVQLDPGFLFQAAGLHFRHTDNINYWRDAMSHVGLPSVTSPPRREGRPGLCPSWWRRGCTSPSGLVVGWGASSLSPPTLGHRPFPWESPPELPLVLPADLPPGDHRHLRQEEHAPGGLLHPRAQVGVPALAPGPTLSSWFTFMLTSLFGGVTPRPPGLG